MPPLVTTFLMALLAGAGVSEAAPVERLRGMYLQQAVELAAVGDRPVVLSRMTRFLRCGTRRPLAEDLNQHLVEVVGREVPGVGFVAGIVNAIEGCGRPPDRRPLEPGGR